jgi:hypothetical protein
MTLTRLRAGFNCPQSHDAGGKLPNIDFNRWVRFQSGNDGTMIRRIQLMTNGIFDV